MSELFDGEIVGEIDVVFSDGLTRPLPFADLDGMGVFQGDIVLGRTDELLSAAVPYVPMGIGRTGARFRWPGGQVAYEVDPRLPNPERVEQALQHWEATTVMRFRQITPSNRHQFSDFLSFQDRGGCRSNVGRIGGRQVVSLGSGCSVGNAIHEIGHAVGLWHEQSRGDRDRWITINWDAIKTSARRNFEQHTEDGRDLGAYDYGSIMHYPATAFSIDGRPTIVPKQDVAIGQRDGLSGGDIAAVGELYPNVEDAEA